MTEETVISFHPLDAAVVAEITAQAEAALEIINREVAGKTSLEGMVELVAHSLAAVAPCDRYGLAFLEEDGERLVSRIAYARYPKVLLPVGYAEDLRGSSLESVIRQRSVRIIQDLEAYVRLHPTSRSSQLLVEEGVRSSMTCPLLVDGRVVGVLFRSSRRPHAYRLEHLAVQMAIVDRLSQAVEKAWRISRLEEARRQQSETMAFVVHELKGPLAGLIMDAEILLGGYLGNLAPEQQDKLGRMVGKAQHLMGLIKDHLDLARLETGPAPVFRPRVDLLGEVVGPVLDLCASQLDQQRMVVERRLPSDGSLTVPGDPDLLRLVWVNLIGNAAKYGQPGGQVRLEGGRVDDQVWLRVWNEGPGFTPQSKGRLFRRFSRLDEPELRRRPGTGLGLYTAWRIVKMHGGRIEADSQPGHWAAFTVWLPALAQGQTP